MTDPERWIQRAVEARSGLGLNGGGAGPPAGRRPLDEQGGDHARLAVLPAVGRRLRREHRHRLLLGAEQGHGEQLFAAGAEQRQDLFSDGPAPAAAPAKP